jgi:hypothetical protein
VGVWLITTITGWVGGVFAYPHILPITDVRHAVVAVFLGGAIAGCLRGRTAFARAAWSFGFVAFVGLVAALTCGWLWIRGWAFWPELALPFAIAVLAFLPIHRWLSRRLDGTLPRREDEDDE